MSAAKMVLMSEEELAATMRKALGEALTAHGGGPLLVDKQALARQLDCSAAHIDNLRKRGLPAVRIGAAVRFEPARVLEWLRTHQDEEREH